MKRIMTFFFLLLSLPCSSYTSIHTPGQSDTTDFMFRDDAERIMQDTDDDSEDSELMDYLDDLRRNPIDINTADADQLSQIPLITPAIAGSIIDYRRSVNGFSSKRDLLKVDGIDERLYELISGYLIAKRPKVLTQPNSGESFQERNFFGEVRSVYLSDLQIRKGYLNGAYEGARPRIANRLRLNYIARGFTIKAGLATDKDPGEKNYADFISAFASMQMNGILRNITIGDYQLSFGNGLALSNFYRSPKSFESSARLSGKGRLRTYASSGEANFFRGMATEFAFGELRAIMFFSRRSLDATIDTLTGQVRTVYEDGYHRTSSELKRKSNLTETLFGGRMEFTQNEFRAGATFHQSGYDPPVAADTLKKLYGLSGNKTTALGLDASFIRGPLSISGECAVTDNGALAFYGSLNLRAGSRSELMFAARRYPYNFISVHVNAPGERSDAANESGFMAGIKIKPAKGIVATAIFDQYFFPYRTFYNPAPSRGNDFIATCDYKIPGGTLFSLRVKNETKEEGVKINDDEGRVITQMIPRKQFNIRAGVTKGNKSLLLRCRYEYCLVKYSRALRSERGSLIFGDLSSQLSETVGISGRVIFFHTDGYDSRIYEFEREVPGIVSNIALYGKGVRWYLMTVMKPFQGVKISAKYAETFYTGVRKTGSGNDEVQGDILNRLLLSVEIKF